MSNSCKRNMVVGMRRAENHHDYRLSCRGHHLCLISIPRRLRIRIILFYGPRIRIFNVSPVLIRPYADRPMPAVYTDMAWNLPSATVVFLASDRRTDGRTVAPTARALPDRPTDRPDPTQLDRLTDWLGGGGARVPFLSRLPRESRFARLTSKIVINSSITPPSLHPADWIDGWTTPSNRLTRLDSTSRLVTASRELLSTCRRSQSHCVLESSDITAAVLVGRSTTPGGDETKRGDNLYGRRSFSSAPRQRWPQPRHATPRRGVRTDRPSI